MSLQLTKRTGYQLACALDLVAANSAAPGMTLAQALEQCGMPAEHAARIGQRGAQLSPADRAFLQAGHRQMMRKRASWKKARG